MWVCPCLCRVEHTESAVANDTFLTEVYVFPSEPTVVECTFEEERERGGEKDEKVEYTLWWVEDTPSNPKLPANSSNTLSLRLSDLIHHEEKWKLLNVMHEFFSAFSWLRYSAPHCTGLFSVGIVFLPSVMRLNGKDDSVWLTNLLFCFLSHFE